MEKKTRLLVTIDTEMDADIHWVKKWPPQYSSVVTGIPEILRPIWNKYGVMPIYFVSPEVLYCEECCRVLKEEICYGAVIGAHLHPEYIDPDSEWGKNIEYIAPKFPNVAYSKEIEFKKIQNLTNLIEEKLGVRPIWYRAARFGADIDTIHSLEQMGYQYDSSVTPGIDWSEKGGPNHSRGRKYDYQIDALDYYKEGTSLIREYPITISGKRWGYLGKILPDVWLFYQWLRPTHMTYLEMKSLLRKKHDGQTCVMMFHSMEIMVNKTPYVRNKWMQKYYLWRLEKILAYAQKKGIRLELP